MIRADQIPDEVWYKAMYEYHKIIRIRPASAWKEAVAAALNAWPEMECRPTFGPSRIILPLNTEPRDD